MIYKTKIFLTAAFLMLTIPLMVELKAESPDKTKNHCKLAIDKTIKCLNTKDHYKQRREMKRHRTEIITNCLLDKFEFKRAEVCLEIKKCKGFMRCITGHTIKK